MTATEYVILVDKEDNEIGLAEKISAHEKNLLHRAFSVFIFRNKPQKEVLIQQRALTKYHSPGLWTNTCCSHPRLGESILDAGERRLHEEMGFTTMLTNVGSFIYNAHFDNGLSENEFDHVLIGTINSELNFTPNPDEVESYKWLTIEQLEADITANPENYTPWLPLALQIVKESAQL